MFSIRTSLASISAILILGCVIDPVAMITLVGEEPAISVSHIGVTVAGGEGLDLELEHGMTGVRPETELQRPQPIEEVAGGELSGPESTPSTAKPRQQLERLSGCFEVTYRFVEDGVQDMFSPRWKLEEPVTEWVGFERDADGNVVLPHVTIRPDGNPVPHWYEVWIERPDEESWTQEVWSHSPGHEDSELRYRCTAPWQGNTWSCHAGRAAKPFRDDGAPFGFDRTDYEWLDRSNTLIVTPAGWVQQEHNRKMSASGEVVSHELGWIVYRQVDEKACGRAVGH